MDGLDKPTRCLTSFASVDEVVRWLYHWGCATEGVEKQIEALWDARAYRLAHPEQFARHTLDYKFRIRVRQNQHRFVTWERRLFDTQNGRD